MSEACLAQRPDSNTAASPYYLWEAPGKPVAVRISHNVVDRLDRAAVETFRSISSKGSEIGGMLLGCVLPGTPAVVSVDDYEPISCDYSRGPFFHLSDADTGRLQSALARGRDGVRVVGFFRSHTRNGLALDGEDLALMEAHFRNPQAVALLVRPFATKPSIGGIFIREDGQAPGSAELPGVPVPIRASAGVPGSSAKLRAQGRDAGSTAAGAREADARPGGAHDLAPEGGSAGSARASTAHPGSSIARAAGKAGASGEARAAAGGSRGRGAARAGRSLRPRRAGRGRPGSRVERRCPLRAAAYADALDLGSRRGGPGSLLGHALRLPRSAAPWKRPAGDPLTLRVEHSAGDLLLTWNRDSDAIRNARNGVLTISDGDRNENHPWNAMSSRPAALCIPR